LRLTTNVRFVRNKWLEFRVWGLWQMEKAWWMAIWCKKINRST